MVAFSPFYLKSIPVTGAAIAGAAVALAAMLMPPGMLEGLAWDSGIAALIPAAAPPLGVTARALLALGGAGVAAAVAWAALYLLWGQGGPLATTRGDAPVLRRADAHPDAPPRWPISAADLGTPLMEVERAIPADLDQPIAAFDPYAIPAAAREPVRPVSPVELVRPAAPIAVPRAEVVAGAVDSDAPRPLPLGRGERIETFEFTPVVRIAPRAPEPEAPATIDTLLRRLEEGAVRRAARTG